MYYQYYYFKIKRTKEGDGDARAAHDPVGRASGGHALAAARMRWSASWSSPASSPAQRLHQMRQRTTDMQLRGCKRGKGPTVLQEGQV